MSHEEHALQVLADIDRLRDEVDAASAVAGEAMAVLRRLEREYGMAHLLLAELEDSQHCRLHAWRSDRPRP